MEDDDTIGEIRLFAGTFAPVNWVFCDGATLPVTGNEALFSLIGTTWGGDNRNFKVPDLRDRVPIGQGTGTGLTNRVVGTSGGANAVLAETPPHSHEFRVSTAIADKSSPDAAMLAVITPTADVRGLYLKVPGTDAAAAADCITPVGGVAHPNCMPSLALNYIICTRGLYPVGP